MTTSKDLVEILAAVEKATGPDRELDVAICLALNYLPYIDCAPINLRRSDDDDWLDYETIEDGETIGCTDVAPSLTASIDAALALVEKMLPRHAVDMTRFNNGQGMAALWRGIQSSKAETDDVFASVPLAILTALLRTLTQETTNANG